MYYFAREGLFLFGSELKSLLQHPDLPRDLSARALDDYLSYGYVPGDRCIINGVKKLPPGMLLCRNDRGTDVRPYWQIDMGENDVTDERAWIDELERRLAESVRIRLRSDVPLGIFLSGGIDSSLVVALAAGVSDQPVRTFSVGFAELDFNELKYARLVAEKYGTDHQEIIVGDQNIDVLAELAYFLDEPMADPSAMPTFFLCREARRHATVCLSGDGGDEVFAGYTRYREALDYERIDRWTPRIVRRMAGGLARSLPSHFVGRGWLRRVSLDGPERYQAQCEKFPLAERRRLLQPGGITPESAPWLFQSFFESNGSRSIVTTLQHADQATYLPDDILVKVDRMSMRSALEVRVPLLDHTLVEYVNAVGPHWKLRGGDSKYALRAVARKYLPTELMTRPKMGFGIPIKYWFRDRLESTARDLLQSSDTRCTRWLDANVVGKTIDAHLRGGRDFSRRIWALLIFEHWCRRMGI